MKRRGQILILDAIAAVALAFLLAVTIYFILASVPSYRFSSDVDGNACVFRFNASALGRRERGCVPAGTPTASLIYDGGWHSVIYYPRSG